MPIQMDEGAVGQDHRRLDMKVTAIIVTRSGTVKSVFLSKSNYKIRRYYTDLLDKAKKTVDYSGMDKELKNEFDSDPFIYAYGPDSGVIRIQQEMR